MAKTISEFSAGTLIAFIHLFICTKRWRCKGTTVNSPRPAPPPGHRGDTKHTGPHLLGAARAISFASPHGTLRESSQRGYRGKYNYRSIFCFYFYIPPWQLHYFYIPPWQLQNLQPLPLRATEGPQGKWRTWLYSAWPNIQLSNLRCPSLHSGKCHNLTCSTEGSWGLYGKGVSVGNVCIPGRPLEGLFVRANNVKSTIWQSVLKNLTGWNYFRISFTRVLSVV